MGMSPRLQPVGVIDSCRGSIYFSADMSSIQFVHL